MCAVAIVEHRCVGGKRGRLKRIVEQIRCVAEVVSWCAEILDFARGLMAWCEANRVDYFWDWQKRTSEGRDRAGEEEAKAQYQQTGRAARLFKEFVYQTRESWSCARRVVAKAEHLEKGEPAVRSDLQVEKNGRRRHCMKNILRPGDMENQLKNN